MPTGTTEQDLLNEIEILKEELNLLRQENEFLKKVIDEVPANIYISDLQEGVIWCNKTNEETLGFSMDEIREIGGMEYMQKILHPDDLNVPDDSINHYKNFNGPEYGGIFRAKHKLEREYKWYMGWAKAFKKKANGEIVEIVCVDVDMNRQMNTESQLISALKENLKRKNKLLLNSLRKREVEILHLICRGNSTKKISELLHLSSHTVSTHRKNIQKKLGTANVADLVAFASEAGLG
ncbi:LuxR C-terminal-related transcriptional regulator [Pontibacter sp. SGAir0037]|uniref:LuxR C-terminal-related transcriptional regulator n=1 Tax=Pontibacter sp. SGAir0037 TaxID=2571030 RepID=UPI0010CCEAD6|nr:LuxR C-terminal-related transcriptional regulator [Pontibacter sp. SGAir0037]QCR21829.1 LuxR family transcriptional regulator [Pontibacter sp. SGAir0037]